MKVENITRAVETTYQFEQDLTKHKFSVTLSGDSTNCKLSYIHGIGNIACTKSEAFYKEVMTFLLSKAKGVVLINTISKEIYEWICRNYPVYYQSELPIGYSNGFQYHVCIKNTVETNAYCKDPIPKVVPVPITTQSSINKTRIKEILTQVLLYKRRKIDFVDKFINLL